MNVYISADMEGVTGVGHWDEVIKGTPDYPEFQKQMTLEVASACKGALSAGAKRILIKDAHATARNLFADELPKEAELIRGWSGHPFCMVQGLDSSFDAALMVGYHASAYNGGNPLAHTLSGRKLNSIRINEQLASEFLIHAYAASSVGVPVVFLSGDSSLSEHAKQFIPEIACVSVKTGFGDSTQSKNPAVVLEEIQSTVTKVLQSDLSKCLLKLPSQFQIEVNFKAFQDAYKGAFYPGASAVDDHTIRFESNDYFEILRLLNFVL